MIDGDLQEVSSGLTAQERRTPVVADAAGVPKVVQFSTKRGPTSPQSKL